MKIGFYSPYLDSLSGGERYVLALASHWSKTHEVHLFWDEKSILSKATRYLKIDLSRTHTVENVFLTRNIFKKMMVSRSYDLIFFLSDGSVPTTFAKYNILHFQVPFQHIRVHPIKLGRYQAVVCNSDFTKRNIDASVGVRATVIYPPVEPVSRTRTVKKKIVLSVGRFHPLKKQDVLIEAFRKARFEDYELVLVGGLLPADDLYFKRLKLATKGLPVRLIPNISFEKLTALYSEAGIYWHAAGYRETNPEHMEHFGITTVEAMSAGAVPVVYNGGGLPEIVREGKDGYLWANTNELLNKTRQIISATGNRLADSARDRSKQFSIKKFTDAFDSLLINITR
jgi:glycosyltransferase involved in cell wall biosynthesis